MLAVVLIWGVNFTVVKLALREFAPLAFNSLRFSIATAIMLTFLRVRSQPTPADGPFHLPGRDLSRVILLGLSGHTLYQFLFINGIARTTPANSSLLMATSPIWVTLYGYLLHIEATNRLVAAGILLSFAGTTLLILGGGQGISLGGGSVLGDLLILCGAMVWAAYTAGGKPLLTRHSPLKLTALTMIPGTLALDLISLPTLLRQDWTAVTLLGWGCLAFSAVFAVAVGYVFWYTSVQRVGSSRTAVYSNLTPVIAILTGWLILGDRLALLQVIGAAVVLAGIMLTRQGRTREMR